VPPEGNFVYSLDPATVERLDLVSASKLEGATPAGLLPRGVVDRVLKERPEDVASQIKAELVSGFLVGEPETLLCSKTRGRRPVSVLSTWERVTYRALIAEIQQRLPQFERSRDAHESFVRAPLEAEGARFVVMSDVASFYQYIDHGLLQSELVAQTGDGHIAGAIGELLGSLMGRQFGLPQNRMASDVLAETVMGVVDRKLRRSGLRMWRYNDDFRIVTPSRATAHQALEQLENVLRSIGLVTNEEKTSIRTTERYAEWADAAKQRRVQAEHEFQFDFQDFTDFPSEYDEEYEDPDEDDEVEELHYVQIDDEQTDPDGPESAEIALSLLSAWREQLDAETSVPRYGPDRYIERTILIASLRRLASAGTIDAVPYLAQVLRTDPSLTVAVATYLTKMMRQHELDVDSFYEELLNAEELYISPWQSTWLMEPLRRSTGFTATQLAWVQQCLSSAEPFVSASAADVLSTQGKVSEADLLTLFGRAPVSAKPRLVSAVTRASGALGNEAVKNVIDGRPLYRWISEATLNE
jgi:RNA-directed DNA polymerase